MAELGKAYVQIVPTSKGISGSIQKTLGPEATAAGNSAGTRMSQAMGSKISAMGGKFIKAGAVATAISLPIIAGIKKALSAYETQNLAETKLTEIYRKRMGVSKQAAKETIKLAGAMQKQGVIGDEVTLSGAQQLATFAKYPSTVNKLMPAMGNLLAQQKGVNASEQDAVQIGNLMGKVMQGQTGALKRVGISFTAAQEKVLKYGTEEEKAAVLSEVITSNVGDMNKKLAETPAGKMQQLKNSLGDLWEGIGQALAPALAKVATYLSDHLVPALEKAVGFLQAHPVIAKVVLAITGLLAIGGPLLILLGTVMTAIGAITAPALGVVAAIAAIIAIGGVLMANWSKISAYLKARWAWLKSQAAACWNGIKKNIITPVKNVASNVITAFNNLKSKVAGIWKGIKTAITSPITTAWNTLKGIVNKILGIFPVNLGKILNLKLPKIKVDGGKAPWGIGGKGKKPSFEVTWAAKGLIAKSPQIIGIGDVRGGEAAVPLTPFWQKMDAWGDSIISSMGTIAAAGGGFGGDMKIELFAFPSGPKMYEWVVNTYDTGKKRLG